MTEEGVNVKDVIGRKLQERDEERLMEQSRRKEEAEKGISKTENTKYFLDTLKAGVLSIQNNLKVASAQPKDGLVVYFDNLSSKLFELQKFITDSAMFITSYDLNRRQQQLKDLELEISSCRAQLMPKKKFAFKKKTKQAEGDNNMAVKPTAEGLMDQAVEKKFSVNEHRIDNITDDTVLINPNLILEKDVVASSVKGSTIQIQGVPSAMHLTDISNSTIICGPCARLVSKFNHIM